MKNSPLLRWSVPTLVWTPLLLTVILLLALPRATGRAQARGGPNYAITAINVTQPPTPDYTLTVGVTKTTQIQKWLEIEVQFSAPSLPQAAPGQLAQGGASDLTVRYYVLYGNNRLLTGEVTHTDVLGGQQLYSVMYLAPRSLALLSGNRPFTISDITNIEVQLLKPGVGQPLAVRQVKPGPPLGGSAFQQISGLLLNKMQTPFAPLYWDRYEAIKPATGNR